MTQIGGEGSLGRLVLEVATEMSPADPPSYLLFLLAKEMLVHVVCSLDNGDDGAIFIADYRMPKEIVPVFVGVFQFRPEFVDRLHVIVDAPSADIG